ncbi:MAG: TrkH family potassium uptake protein [Clostridia bacterium]|nr:TrkH family potassium uptake protein [Clostridia bacterium]
MNFMMVVYLLGWIMLATGGMLLLPFGVSLYYSETCSGAFLVTALISIAIGAVLVAKKPKNRIFHLREGFLITALSWIVLSVIGAVPFVISGAIPNFVDALFETASGFTTTGASILTAVEPLPRGILFWRSFTHWIGGMGVLVFLLTLLPLAGGSNTNLMKAESPGPQVSKLVPKIKSTAAILYAIYLGISILECVLLLLGKMPLFDAVFTILVTRCKSGFGIKNDSIAGYSTYIQVIVTIFMILCGINFNFYFFIIFRKFAKAFEIEEVKVYLAIILISITAISVNIYPQIGSVGKTLLQSSFQVGSIITTTGFATADFNTWPMFSKTILVMLMFCGACAGSTGGGIKVSRIIMLFKSLTKEMKHILHPSSIGTVIIDKKPVAHETMRATNVFMVAYVMIFTVSMLIVSLENLDFTTGFTAVAATLNNIGPGLNEVGPTGNFAFFSPLSKLTLTFCMLAGRLEIYPMILLFSKHTWQRF